MARFLTGTEVDDATVSASSAVASLPATNVQDEQRTKVWRSTSLTSQYLRVDFGSAMAFNCIALINHNLTAAGTFTIKAGTSAGDDSLLSETHDAWEPLFGFGDGGFGEHGYGGYLSDDERATYYPAGNFRLIYFTAGQVSARYWEIDFTDAANPDGYFELGRLIMDSYKESAQQVATGFVNTPADPTKVSYSLGGQAWRDQRTKYREASISIRYTDAGETWGFWFALMQNVGVGRSFVVDLFPSATTLGRKLHNQMYCHIPEGGMPDISVPVYERGVLSFDLRESR